MKTDENNNIKEQLFWLKEKKLRGLFVLKRQMG